MEKVVIITGASSGIGRSLALKLVKEGYIVYAGARRLELLKEIKQKNLYVEKLDVTDSKSMDSFVQKVLKNHSRIDVLVNNAGYGLFGSIEEVSIDEAKRQLDVNVFGLAYMSKLVIEPMRKQKAGQIINISSVAGIVAMPLGGWYHASKYAVEGLSDSMRLELSQFNIKVTIIEPGPVKTNWSEIAQESLHKTTPNSPYHELNQKMDKMLQSFDHELGVDVDVIVSKIYEAITTDKPKTRYPVGKNAKKMIFLRKAISDKTYDKSFMKMLNKSK